MDELVSAVKTETQRSWGNLTTICYQQGKNPFNIKPLRNKGTCFVYIRQF